MTERLQWVELNREALPGLIAEGEFPQKVGRVDRPLSSGGDIFVGVLSDERAPKPLLVVLNEKSAREILAWLATYSSASFPITQSMRTMTTEDFGFAHLASASQESSDELAYWPCIVLGELLGQGEYVANIDAVALSRVNACFSFAQARAVGLGGADSIFARACERRLRALESDRLLARRAVSVGELSPIWAWAQPQAPDVSVQRELSRVVETAVNGLQGEPGLQHASLLNSAGFDAQSLSTGTIEERVRSYQAFSQTLESMRDAEFSRSAAMLLAAAAICVGNGTSHVSLLEDFGKKVPAAYAWFGLFAAIGGPKGWDPSWNRAINSVGRMLRSRFEFTEPSIVDLSWVEYEFVRDLPKPTEFLKYLPKLYSRSLAIEVVPGATCQFRLSDDSATGRSVATRIEEARDSQVRPEPNAAESRTSQIAASLAEAERVFSHGQHLLRQAMTFAGPRVPDQAKMFDEPPQRSKKRSTKKGAKERGSP